MATLQKIRAKGPLLVIVIGLALFAFIAEEAMRSIQSASNESKQQQRTQRPTAHSITRPSLEHIRQQQTHRARS